MFLLPNRDRWLNSLQALRALAFLSVLLHHCSLFSFAPWGVSVFFVLAGFVAYYRAGETQRAPTLRDSALFALRHMRRLYPLHLLLIAAVLLGEGIYTGTVPLSGARLASDLLLLGSWIPDTLGIKPYNGVTWFLSTILFSYFLFGYAAGAVRRVGTRRGVLRAAAVVYGVQILAMLAAVRFWGWNAEESFWFTYKFPPFRFADFLIGCLLARGFLLRGKAKRDRRAGTLRELACIGLSLVTVLLYGLRPGLLGTEAVRYTLLVLPCTALCVDVFAAMEGPFTRLLTNRPLVALAKHSASCYLLHQLLVELLIRLLEGAGLSWASIPVRALCFALALPLTWLLAVAYDRACARALHRNGGKP